MPIAILSLAFFAAALCALVMGFAIQRGATCTVAAVHEVLAEGSARRLLGLIEAAIWVAGGLVLAQALHVLPPLASGHDVSRWTFIGAVLLGLGAYVNGACVLGAIARFGSGEWVYLVTPVGFYLGCLAAAAVMGPTEPATSALPPLLAATPVIAVPVTAFVAWRIGDAWRRRERMSSPGWHRRMAVKIWSPHAATTVIALTFIAMLLLVGAWAYTDVLAELARGMAASVASRVVLAVALLIGAVIGARTGGEFRSKRCRGLPLLRCAAGGTLMGGGSVLLPGGNDTLVLLGMPLGWPFAWLAFATMCLTVAGVHLLVRTFATSPSEAG